MKTTFTMPDCQPYDALLWASAGLLDRPGIPPELVREIRLRRLGAQDGWAVDVEYDRPLPPVPMSKRVE